MATTTKPRTTRNTPSKASPATRSRKAVQFDGENSEHWHAIPSKGQLYMLAIAAFNGVKFPGSEVFGSREQAKLLLAKLKEDGKIK